MKRIQWVLLFSLFCCPIAWAGLTGSVTLLPIDDTTFESRGFATWNDIFGENDPTAEFTGEHRVWGGGLSFDSPVGSTGTYDQDLTGPAEPGTCYNTSLSITVNRGWFGSTSDSWADGSECAPVRDDDDDPWELPGCPTSPLVIALNDRYEFTDVASGVTFDIDADGDADRVAWSRDGSVAFLFFDRNGNQKPDDGGELFGDHTRLRNGMVAKHGFEALAEFDSNGDGVVSGGDAQWAQLRLWQDGDHNGVAASNEISTLSANGIASLGMKYHWTGRRDVHGNMVRWQSTIVRDGSGARPYYDVFLVTQATP